MPQPDGGKPPVFGHAAQDGATFVPGPFQTRPPRAFRLARHILERMPAHHRKQRQEPYPARDKGGQQGFQFQRAAHGAHMNVRITRPHRPRQGLVTRHGRMTRAVPHEHHILIRPPFGGQVGQNGLGGSLHVSLIIEQGRPQLQTHGGTDRHLLEHGPDLAVLVAGNALQGLYGHLPEALELQPPQGLEHGIALLSGQRQPLAQEVRGIGPANGQAGKGRPHLSVNAAQGLLSLSSGSPESHQQNRAFHGGSIGQLPAGGKARRLGVDPRKWGR